MNRSFRTQRLLFFRRDRCPYFNRNRLGDLSLQIQHAAELAVVHVGPEMAIGGAVDEFRVDSHAFAIPHDENPADEAVHAQRRGDLGIVNFVSLNCAVDVREMTRRL